MKTVTFKLMISAAIVAGSIGFFATNANAYDNIVCGTRAGFVGDGSANYKPGVDAHGKSVAPADLSPQMPGMGEVIRVPMTVNLEQRLSKMLPAGTELKADAGLVEIYRDGRVLYNGVDITTQTNTLCREKPVVEKAPPKKKVKKVEAPIVEAEPVAADAVAEPAVEPQPIMQESAPVAAEPTEAPAMMETPAVVPDAAPSGEISGEMTPAGTEPAAPTEMILAPETAPVAEPEVTTPEGLPVPSPAPAPMPAPAPAPGAATAPASILPEGSMPVSPESIPAPDAPLATPGGVTILAPAPRGPGDGGL
ncbi:hypothetical protein [Micavibrio aeruginosavorus]|uniref:hypothetical protein n=1 Tax=Micavibrio aeruginosavorus TaxID=349221 RepID=UPI003F4ADCEF